MSKNNQSNHNHGSKSEPNKRKRRDTKPLPSSSSDSDMDEASHLVLYTETGEYAILGDNQITLDKHDLKHGTVLHKKLPCPVRILKSGSLSSMKKKLIKYKAGKSLYTGEDNPPQAIAKRSKLSGNLNITFYFNAFILIFYIFRAIRTPKTIDA